MKRNNCLIIDYSGMVPKGSAFHKKKTDLGLQDASSFIPSDCLSAQNAHCLVLLNKANSTAIEREIEQTGLSCNYAKMVIKHIKKKHRLSFKKDKECIIKILRIIDYENSTNVWIHSREAFYNVVNFIIDSNNNFWAELKKSNPDLVNKLTDASTDSNNKRYYSFASKVCKYLSQYVFKKDAYYINDSVIRRVIPFYHHYYCETKESPKYDKYDELHKLLDEIHNKVNKTEKLSNTEIDHVMWYCYKDN